MSVEPTGCFAKAPRFLACAGRVSYLAMFKPSAVIAGMGWLLLCFAGCVLWQPSEHGGRLRLHGRVSGRRSAN